MVMFFAMRYNEVHGHWPLMKAKKAAEHPKTSRDSVSVDSVSGTGDVEMIGAENFGEKGNKNIANVRQMRREDSSSSSSPPSRTIAIE